MRERKQLRRATIVTMEQSFKPLSEEFLSRCTGKGFVSSYSMLGGTVTNWSYDGYNYAQFNGDDGRVIVLDGVHVGGNTLLLQKSNTACYYNGEIRVGTNFGGFDLNDLMHEYGHYIQTQKMSSLSYANQAVGSAWSASRDNPEHLERWFEQQATEYGQTYLASYYGYPYSY